MPCVPGFNAKTPPASGWSDRSPPGRIEVIANYTAFQDLRRRVGN